VLALTAVLALLWVTGGQAAAQTGSATEISSCTNVTTSGTYVVTGDVSTDTEGTCISVQAADVVLDGQGHEIEGGGYPESTAIEVTADNVTVRNVVVTNFNQGVYFSRATDGRVANVTARLNDVGIGYRTGSDGEIVDSTAYDNGGIGIYSFGTDGLVVRANNVSDNGRDGIWINSGGTVVDNVATGNEDDGIIVRNVDRSDTTTVRNNSVGALTVFIARTGTVADNDADFLRVSEAWNVTVRDNDVSGTLDIREVNDSTFTGNTVGSNLQITGGFRGMSGTDRRTVCMQGLVVEDTGITATSENGGPLDIRDNTSGAVLRNVSVGSATLWLSASQNVTVAPTDSPASNPDATALGTYLRVAPRQEAGKATVAVTYDESALGDGEGPLLYRHDGDGWTALDSYATNGRVGATITLTNGTVVGAFGASESTVDDHRVDRPTSVEIQCGQQNVTIVRQNTTVTRTVTETRTAGASGGGDLPVSMPLLGGGVAAVLLAGLLVAGLRRRSGDDDSDEGGAGGTADDGPAPGTGRASRAASAGTTNSVGDTGGSSPASGDRSTRSDTSDGPAVSQARSATSDAGTAAATEQTPPTTAGNGTPATLIVESEAFEPLTAHVRIKDDETELFRESFDLTGGERCDATELPSSGSFAVEAVVDDGSADRTLFADDRARDVRVRLDGDHLEITRQE